MQSNKPLLAIAVVAGLMATVLAFVYIRSATSALEQHEEEPMVPVMFVRADLPANHMIDPDEDLRVESVGANSSPALVQGAVKEDEREALRGRRINAPLAAGIPLMYAHLATIQNINLAPGTRAMSIRVDSTGLMGGILVPGDHVDIIVSYEAEATQGTAMSNIDTSDPQAAMNAIFGQVMQQTTSPNQWNSEIALANIRVVAVGDQLQASRQQLMYGLDGMGGGGAARVVTLEVTTDQALSFHRLTAGGSNPVTLLLRPDVQDRLFTRGGGGMLESEN